MGIQNRDYVREEYGSGPPSWMAEFPATRTLIVITVTAFVGQLLLKAGPGEASLVDVWGVMNPSLVMQGQVWRLLSYAFLHSLNNPLHIFFNMLTLYFFGREMERVLGQLEFIAFYLVSAVFAATIYLVWGFVARSPAPMLGASGAVMAVLMLYACHFPRRKVFLFGAIPLEIRMLVALYVLMDALPLLQSSADSFLNGGVAHACHLGGLAFGYVYYRKELSLTGWLPADRGAGWAAHVIRPSRRERLRVFQPEPEPENLDAELDRILVKIKDEGSESLTRQERTMLERASQKFKNKQR